MTVLRRSMTVSAPLPRVADYLSDLVTSPEWDLHTIACRRLDDGPLGTGSRYEHTRRFQRYEVTLQVEVVDYEERVRVAWAGDHEFAGGREEFSFRSDEDGRTVVEHRVEITLRGVARLGERMVPSVMKRIADDGTEPLRLRLEQLG